MNLSIYFLEDLEALQIALQAHLFFHENEIGRCSLLHEEQRVTLSLEALTQSQTFRPLMKRYLLPLMQRALKISPGRFEQLSRLHLAVPREIQAGETNSLFLKLFQLFKAISKDLVSVGSDELAVNVVAFFQEWQAEREDVLGFVDGGFSREADLLLILKARFTETIADRVSKISQKYSRPLEQKEFFSDLLKLINQYFLKDCKIKKEFIVAFGKLKMIDTVFMESESWICAEQLMKKIAFTEEELSALRNKGALSVEEQLVVLHAVYLKVFELFLAEDPQVFVDFICKENGLLDLCLQHVESKRLDLLFSELISPLVFLHPNTDPNFKIKLGERYQQAGVAYSLKGYSDVLMMHKLKPNSDPNLDAVLSDVPEGSAHVGGVFPAVLPVLQPVPLPPPQSLLCESIF